MTGYDVQKMKHTMRNQENCMVNMRNSMKYKFLALLYKMASEFENDVVVDEQDVIPEQVGQDVEEPLEEVQLQEETRDVVLPSAVLDLLNWYLTLPCGKEGSPDCIYQSQLSQYQHPEFFHVNDTKDGVVFKAPVEGVRTANTSYTRSELRSMFNSGTKKAAWNLNKGKHTMIYEAAVTHLPEVKPSVVVGQIHDTKDDVIEVRLTKKLLEVIHDKTHYGALDENYELGKKFKIKIEADNGKIKVYYNDMNKAKLTISSRTKGCYFKLGCYTQSNLDKGDKPGAYGETVVYNVKVEHIM
jgi:poly(beta-D-mannuronate) lyase